MLQLITEHLRTAAALGIGAVLLLLWRAGTPELLWRWASTIIRMFRESDLRIALKESEQLKTTVTELRADLLQEVRTNAAFGDINKQDRATIRTLVTKIDQHNALHQTLKDDRLCLIDYSDVHEEVKRSLGL